MRCEGTSIQRRQEKSAPALGRERASELALALLFICLSLPGPVLCKLGQPGVLFVLPEVLTPVLGPSFVLFSRAFPFLVFQPPPFWTPFPYSTYLTMPLTSFRCCYLAAWGQERQPSCTGMSMGRCSQIALAPSRQDLAYSQKGPTHWQHRETHTHCTSPISSVSGSLQGSSDPFPVL